MGEFTIGTPNRSCYCRICHHNFERGSGEKYIRFYSNSRQCGVDFLCFPCVREMQKEITKVEEK